MLMDIRTMIYSVIVMILVDLMQKNNRWDRRGGIWLWKYRKLYLLSLLSFVISTNNRYSYTRELIRTTRQQTIELLDARGAN